MKDDDAEILETLLEKILGTMKSVEGGRRDTELALEIVRQRRAEHDDRSDGGLLDLVDESRFTVRWKGAECHLGPTVSFRLLHCLARTANRYVTVERLLEVVWKDDRSEAAVRSAVRALRRKLEDFGMEELAKAIEGHRCHYRLLLDGVAHKN